MDDLMRIPLFIKLFLTLVAVSLIAFFFVPDATPILLLKLLALSIGAAILFALFYPSLRGIQKGDRVMVSRGNLPSFFGFGRTGIAAEAGRLQKEIKVRFADGREALCIVESYGGAFSIPRVRLLYEESIKE